MNKTGIVKAVVFGLIIGIAPKLAVADDLGSMTPKPSLIAAAKTEAIKFAGKNQAAPSRSSVRQTSSNKTARRVAYGIGLGLAGFYAGGLIGAAVEPNCHCDDPGLQGLVIGAPIGAIAGAVFGAWLGGR